LDDFPTAGAPNEGGSGDTADSAANGAVNGPDQDATQTVKDLAAPGATSEPAARPVRARRAWLPRFPSKKWRNIALVLGLAVATMVGASGQLVFSAMTSSSPTRKPVAVASAPRTALATPTSLPTPTAPPTPTAAPTPTPLPQTAATAMVVFRDLMLDNQAAGGSRARTFTFTSDGPGTVSVHVTAAAPLDAIKFCLTINDQVPNCLSGATPGFSLAAPEGDHAQWTISLIATKPNSTPIVDVTFIWPTVAPSITMTHGRFQGLPNPDSLRGFIATFTPRVAGAVGLSASWPPASAAASVILIDVTKPAAVILNRTSFTGGSIGQPYSYAVLAGHRYQLQILNGMKDAGRPDLTATLTFP
jgi:hypothetical protein